MLTVQAGGELSDIQKAKIISLGVRYAETPTLAMRQLHRAVRYSIYRHVTNTGSESIDQIVFQLDIRTGKENSVERTRSYFRAEKNTIRLVVDVSIAEIATVSETGRWLVKELGSVVISALQKRIKSPLPASIPEILEPMFYRAVEGLSSFIEPEPSIFEVGPGSTW